MGNKKEDTLRESLQALFGETTGQQPPTPRKGQEAGQTEDKPSHRDELIDTLDDEKLKAALHSRRMEHRGRPRKNESFKSVTTGYGRVTTIMNLEKVKKLKYIALKETLTLKDIWDECLDIAIRRYEAKHGKIVLPKQEEQKRPRTAKEVFE